MSNDKDVGRSEIHRTLGLCNFCTRKIGLSFIDEPPNNLVRRIAMNSWLMISTIVLFLMLAGEIGYVTTKFVTSSSVVEFVSSLHIVGYDTMSFGKLLTIWYKRNVFKHLLKELEDIWPVSVRDKEAADIKRERLSALRIGQFWYAFWNILGVWLYNLTPIVIYVYKKIQKKPANLGYVWLLSYPFDKTKPGYHEAAFIFEAYGGVVSVWCMLGSDMLFMTMASHISMLLQILQVKIRRLGAPQTRTIGGVTNADTQDCYSEIVFLWQILQTRTIGFSVVIDKINRFNPTQQCTLDITDVLERIRDLSEGDFMKCSVRMYLTFSYGNNLEDAFSVVNLINVLLSSVNICCVVFNILLDPWMAMSNKFFLGAALTQVGILCWYADDIYKSSLGVGDAVYESEWYNTNIRCRRILHVLMQRSQKPLYITAFKFRFITMSTYSSILTSSYSYFTLLHTVYRSD